MRGYPVDDSGRPKICSDDCIAEGERLCVRQPRGPGCVECLADADCLNNPRALGVTCDPLRNSCICSDDSDCFANENGSRCDPETQRCGCSGEGECAAPRKCDVDGDKTCHAPCSSDEQCIRENQGMRTKCDPATKACVECTDSADCANHRNGGLCKEGKCTCNSGADCQGGYRYGNACPTPGERCGCDGEADCVGNPRGPWCLSAVCTCEKDEECTVAPYSLCLPLTGSLKTCQQPCTTTLDCLRDHQRYLPLCDLATKQCVQCMTNSNCNEYQPLCRTAEHRCVECETSAHCTNASNPVCRTDYGRCVECQSHADCATMPLRRVCKPEPSGTCAECTENAHCAQSPRGKKCAIEVFPECACRSNDDCLGVDDHGYEFHSGNYCLDLADPAKDECGCRGAEDCVNNRNGPHCHAGNPGGGCICYNDADCTKAPYTKCAYYSTLVHRKCRKPCNAHEDCADTEGLPYCDTATHLCAECRTDVDCPPPQTSHPGMIHCDADGRCAYCTNASHCEQSTGGALCEKAVCTCKGDGDCRTGFARGNRCLSPLHMQGGCGCESGADCEANVHGAVCNTTMPGNGFCSCVTADDCSNPAQPHCKLAFPSAPYSTCSAEP